MALAHVLYTDIYKAFTLEATTPVAVNTKVLCLINPLSTGSGYMAPEYISGCRFSIKSDVFSFGVLVLEIVTGRKNGSCRPPEGAQNLLSYVSHS